jgi:16S rRNA (guanine966-N2)-methyltransferase
MPYYVEIMRITGGIYCRQQIRAPKGEVRPTQDMVREALFSIIGPRVEGTRFLDLFAGSGVVGLEALSRGAKSACWVESDRRVITTLKENIYRICGKEENSDGSSRIRFFMGDVLTFLQKKLENQQFDLIFADPPYGREGQKDWLSRILGILGSGTVLAKGGLFIIEQSSKEIIEEYNAWDLVKDRVYGGTRLRFFARKKLGDTLND